MGGRQGGGAPVFQPRQWVHCGLGVNLEAAWDHLESLRTANAMGRGGEEIIPCLTGGAIVGRRLRADDDDEGRNRGGATQVRACHTRQATG